MVLGVVVLGVVVLGVVVSGVAVCYLLYTASLWVEPVCLAISRSVTVAAIW